jgi:hypothetical protein
MRCTLTAMIAALVLSYAATAHAQSRTVYVFDPGNDLCGKYLAAAHDHPPGKGRALDRPEGQYSDEHSRYMAWVDGFLSATNWWVMDAERNDIQNDGAAIDVWTRKWCEQNPTKHLIEAASAFVWDQRKEYLLAWFARQAR